MRALIYKIIYTPFINRVLRNLTKPLAKLLKVRLPLSVSGVVRLKYDQIDFQLATNPTCAVTQELFFNEPAAYEFTPLFAHLAKQSGVFFDIGANIGYFTVLGEKLNPELTTLAFEPSKGVLHYLKRNIHDNHVKNAIAIDKAVSNQTGDLTFYDVVNPKYPWIKHQLNGSNSLQNQHGAKKQHSYPVTVTTLEEVVREYQIKNIDLIKLDTECTEHHIMSSGKTIIETYRPVIICEVYAVIEAEMAEIVHSLFNYHIYHYTSGKLFPIAGFSEVVDDMNRNFIFCPTEKLFLIHAFIHQKPEPTTDSYR